MTHTNTLSLKGATEQEYDYYLAVSSDSLMVFSRNIELIEVIINGSDKSALLLGAPDEDCFLEAITVIKSTILSGKNPLYLIL